MVALVEGGRGRVGERVELQHGVLDLVRLRIAFLFVVVVVVKS